MKKIFVSIFILFSALYSNAQVTLIPKDTINLSYRIDTIQGSSTVINNDITWSVLDSLNTPPGSPTAGDLVLVGTAPTGAFATHANKIASWSGSSWSFLSASTGDLLYNAATNIVSKWTSVVWLRVSRSSLLAGGNNGITNLKAGTIDNKAFSLIQNNTKRLTFSGGTVTWPDFTNGFLKVSSGVMSADNSTYLTGNQAVTVTATGDATGTSNASATAPTIPLTLATVNPNVGTFNNATVTVNAKGQITAAANGSASSYSAGYGLNLNSTTFKADTNVLMTDLGWIDIVQNEGADSTGVTDVTAAINHGLARCDAHGGGTVFLRVGAYNVAGALSTNSQIQVPFRALSDPKRCNLRILGETPPSFTPVGFALSAFAATPVITSGVILKCGLRSGTTGGFVIGSGSTSAINYNYLTVENIAIIIPNNPTGTGPITGGISAKYLASVNLKNVVVSIDTSGYRSTYPSNNVTGIETPIDGSETFNTLDNVLVVGMKDGFMLGEHVEAKQIQTFHCRNGLNLKGNTHDINIGRYGSFYSINNIYVSAGPSPSANVHIDVMDVEWLQEGKWYDQAYTINDSASRLHGSIGYDITDAGSVRNNAHFTVNGATGGVQTYPIYTGIASGSNTWTGTQTYSSMTAASIPYFGTGGVLSQANANLNWDNTNLHLAAGKGIQTGRGAATFLEPVDGFASLDNAILEIYRGTSVSNDTKFAQLQLATYQNGTANAIGGIYFLNNAISTDRRVASIFVQTDGATNTGSMQFYTMKTGTLAEAGRWDKVRNLLIGGTGSPTSSAGNIVLYNGTAATGNATNGIILESISGELNVRDASGNVTVLSPHHFNKIPNGHSNKMAWAYYSEKDNNYINVDMYLAVKTIEQQSAAIEELRKEIAELKGVIYKKQKPVKLIYTGRVK